MLEWYRHEIVSPGRELMLWALLAFVFTFLITRMITRAIRSGRGPFHDVSAGSVHIHHAVPGVISLLLSGVILMAASDYGPWVKVGALLFGFGAALVLDEFALILHLDDVYWKREGALSVDAITVALAVMTCALLVAAPDNPPGPDSTDPHVKVLTPVAFVLLWLLPAGVALMKGRLFLAALSVLTPIFGWWGALRLARPWSPWAARRYRTRPEKMDRARARAAAADRRIQPVRSWWAEHVFGIDPGQQSTAELVRSGRGVSAESDAPANPPDPSR